ncbi:PXDN [Lepeophtheirus salmonis]|uniref:peroxidase n=1 Tax=Lepeophtheirus salmonis TaxID=72036 RepID=A0A7R8CG79_LEPSM|nr:PXDN [Lepeophtheirus salmonis]CAF2773533.1 PXDN [Lepeophtheirus salmonis]
MLKAVRLFVILQLIFCVFVSDSLKEEDDLEPTLVVWRKRVSSYSSSLSDGRVARRIYEHPDYYLTAPRDDEDAVVIVPREFSKDVLPSTPELNYLMSKSMDKVKKLIFDLEKEKKGIKPLPKKATRNVTLAALLIEEVTRQCSQEDVGQMTKTSKFVIDRSYALGRGEVSSRVENVRIEDTMLSELCPDVRASFCFPQNIVHQMQSAIMSKIQCGGVTGAAYLRLKKKLPDASTVSSKLVWTHNNPHEHITAIAATWGEFVAHDISYTLPLSGFEQCCDSMFRKEKMPWNASPLSMIKQFAKNGSGIYGSTPKSGEDRRKLEGGLLKMGDPEGNVLPLDKNNPNCRPNLDMGMNEHNRVARSLEGVNPHWDEETLYQEARRIVSAEIQHITYNEFLPAILELPVTTLNSVGNAILPFVLSLFPPKLNFFNSKGKQTGQVPFNSTYWAPFHAKDKKLISEILLGLSRTPAQKADLVMARDTKIYLNQDLVANIIHRGRDHGLPTYTQVRETCGLSPVRNFEELSNTVDKEVIGLLETTYEHVSDVDLFIGGLAERPLSGGVVGPTFGCLLGQQFQILKKGDRFWYENNIPPSAYGKDQLLELRKVTLASLICSNFKDIHEVQPEVFLNSDPYLNSPVHCDIFPQINFQQWKTDSPALQVPEAILIQTLEKGTQGLVKRRKEEYMLWEHNMGANPQSSLGTAFAFSRPNKVALKLSNTSLLLEYTSRVFINSLQEPENNRIKRQVTGNSDSIDVNIDDFADGLTNIDVTRVIPTNAPLEVCPFDENSLPCDHTHKYRTMNGWCNNLNNPQYGKSVTPLVRFLSAKYDDAISRPRFRSATGKSLPSPRMVSIVVHADVSHLHGRYTLMLMQFGQFLDHDITLTPVNKGFPDSILDCRGCDSARTVHPECWPISVPKNDPYFPALNTTSGRAHCIAFTRSLPGQQRLGPREQVNQNTAFIDASMIYGNDKCDSIDLRQNIDAASGFCFKGGDARASEQPGLAALHTIFLREHNRLVTKLKRVNPHWTVNQHITYNEFLPRIIGWNYMNLYNLRVQTQGYSSDYESTCNPGIFNEFATAAFRFGHSLIRPMLTRMSADWKEKKKHIRLRDGFFNPDMLYQETMIDEVIRGLVATPMENQDQFISGEITNHLGRDHGLRPYNEYRVACNLKKARTFEDLGREINADVIKRLKQVYDSVDDVDLFTGGLSENPLQGALVGPTFACIIGIQFQKIKKCDQAQLTEIRKMTLGKIICENCDIVGDIQKSIFDQPHEFLNPRVPCRSVPDIDLSHWKEEVTNCRVNGLDITLGSSRKISPCTSCTCTKEGAQCQSLKINNCGALISEFGEEAVRRDNICKTQCSFALNSNLVIDAADQLQAPGFTGLGANSTTTTSIKESSPNYFTHSRVRPPPPPVLTTVIHNAANVAANLAPPLPSIPAPSRQPRPLFSFLPRLPNLSELFGL